MKKYLLSSALLGGFFMLSAQEKTDSLAPKTLQEVLIRAWQRRDVTRLPEELNGFLFTGKKNEVVNLAGTNAHVAIKTGRQLFSKVPGVFIYDMDGSGNQLNISSRGLDPHRSWEFNIRQNGIIINSDMYGYPASHYSAPMESYEKIEIVRGTGSLQYGAQFGGMINYITRRPDSTRPISFESINTIGSYGLMSTYNAISGTKGKFSYYAYYQKRHANGYRYNSQSDAEAEFVHLQYRFSEKTSLKAEFGRSFYKYKIPGPLNDSMFDANPRMSTRERNYFSPDIYVPSLSLTHRFSSRTQLSIVASGVFGTRSSVMIDAFATVPDTIDRSTSQYKNRQVDIDKFNSKTVELRILHGYVVGNVPAKLVTGIVYMNNDLHRRQLGKGTTGTNYDLTLVDPLFGRNIHFRSNNVAVFAENNFMVSPRLTISPGFRWEKGDSKMSGIISYYTVNPLPTRIDHDFMLTGINAQYQLMGENIVYAGWSQAYRPVIFKDIVPASTYEQIDKNLKDAFGWNAEIGVRGKWGTRFQYDLGFFAVDYHHRLGTLVLTDNNGQPYTFRTNIGNSRTWGSELFAQYKFPVGGQFYAGIFTSTAFTHARYYNAEVSTGTTNKSIDGNRVESVPRWNTRQGLDLLYKGFSATLLYSYTSATYSDALNTIIPPATGAKGYTPGYGIFDINASLRTSSPFFFRAGVNNLFNKSYFTKRPTFYPGPGIWPSDGRNFYITIGVRG